MDDPVAIAIPTSVPDTPVAYQLQGTGSLEIKSLATTYDGTGAGSDFYPVMSIYTADGLLLSRTRTASPITAGDSGVVTFAPFLRQAAQQDLGLPWASQYDSGPAIIASGVPTRIKPGSFSESVFKEDYFTFTGPGIDTNTLHVVFSGVYSITAIVDWGSAFAGVKFIELEGPAIPNGSFAPLWRQYGGDNAQVQTLTVTISLSGGTFPSPIRVFVFQASGGNQTLAQVWLEATYLQPAAF